MATTKSNGAPPIVQPLGDDIEIGRRDRQHDGRPDRYGADVDGAGARRRRGRFSLTRLSSFQSAASSQEFGTPRPVSVSRQHDRIARCRTCSRTGVIEVLHTPGLTSNAATFRSALSASSNRSRESIRANG